MKITIVTQEEFTKIMHQSGGVLRFKDSGHSHATLTYCRDVPSKYGYMKVKDIGWQHIDYYQDEEQHTFTVPTFLYEAYIK